MGRWPYAAVRGAEKGRRPCAGRRRAESRRDDSVR